MKNKNLTLPNYIGLGLCLTSLVYVLTIYLVMFFADPTYFAWRLYIGQGGEYFGKIFVSICIFIMSIVLIPASVSYTMMKYKDQHGPNNKKVSMLLIVGAFVYAILIFAFFVMQGSVFNGAWDNAESTVYRFIDIIGALMYIGGVALLVGYTYSYDSFTEIRRKKLSARATKNID